MTIQQVVNNIKFGFEHWPVQGANISPIPGTWTLPPPKAKRILPPSTRALLSCPNCGTACILLNSQLEEDLVEHTASVERWQCSHCKFVCNPTLLQFDRRKLYCAAFERFLPNGTVEGIKEYYHGIDKDDVLLQFNQGHPETNIKIVAIGVVIGYFVDDDKGNELHV